MTLSQEQKNSILDAGHRVVLDGTATHKDLIVPFDAHDQTIRGVHTPTGRDTPDIHKDDVEEFPKAIAHDEKTGEPVIAKNAEHEAELRAQIKAASSKKEVKK